MMSSKKTIYIDLGVIYPSCWDSDHHAVEKLLKGERDSVKVSQIKFLDYAHKGIDVCLIRGGVGLRFTQWDQEKGLIKIYRNGEDIGYNNIRRVHNIEKMFRGRLFDEYLDPNWNGETYYDE